MKTLINKLLSPAGYEIRRKSEADAAHNPVVYYSYGEDGAFDYERYKQVQIEGNKRKLENVWVIEDNIAFLSDYLSRTLGHYQNGVCHGTRRGKEQEWFRKYLPSESVIGTEISDTAKDFPHTLQWDFHEPKKEWKNHFDFVYSNSFDHSYDPEKCLSVWMDSVRPGGLCILEHTDAHGPGGASELDPFGADAMIMPYLITQWAQGRFYVKEIISAPAKNEFTRFIHFFVIQKPEQA